MVTDRLRDLAGNLGMGKSLLTEVSVRGNCKRARRSHDRSFIVLPLNPRFSFSFLSPRPPSFASITTRRKSEARRQNLKITPRRTKAIADLALRSVPVQRLLPYEDIRGVAFTLVTRRALIINNSFSPAVHPSTNTSLHAPRSAIVFSRTQHRTATGQSDRILLLESIENIKICPQWTLRSSSPYTGHQQSLARTHFIHRQTHLVKLHSVVIIPSTDPRQKLSRLGILAIGTLTCQYLQPLPSANYACRPSSDTKLDCQIGFPQMSRELHVEVKDFVKGLYDKLCTKYR
ncbi:hypothetical protein D6D12_07866 [Aureobasidium pullulans]|uniref:Uncharacterized protein n=1 Tax=Aureobasidium pullulans TaxID=5580 RepID=A0AB74JLD6_AURPU|nr:hypothetical protein D6D12_07866 [Aureobasidium pullulans]THX53778.1 hypothetical protein D6D11_04353 [Aureobasidium pullulans]